MIPSFINALWSFGNVCLSNKHKFWHNKALQCKDCFEVEMSNCKDFRRFTFNMEKMIHKTSIKPLS